MEKLWNRIRIFKLFIFFSKYYVEKSEIEYAKTIKLNFVQLIIEMNLILNIFNHY